MQTLDRINNKIGAFWGTGKALDAGKFTETVAADLPTAELHDSSNWLRVALYADFGAGPRLMAISTEWNGAPNAVPPSVSYTFAPNALPSLIYGVLENGTRGAGSPAIAGLTSTSS